jgi:phenylacetate-CoA ligase
MQFGTMSASAKQGKKGKLLLTNLDWNIERVGSFLDELDAVQPAWLSGPPALLSVVAEGLRRSGRHLRRQISFVESTSDWLSPEVRGLLAETFQCRVVNHYGCQETYTIAYECPQGNMHIFDDCVVVELQPREAGNSEIVVSSLIFEAMPFIRYKVGDIIRPDVQTCSCGNSAPVLGQIEGRVSTVIAGTTLPGNHVFYQVVTWMAKAGFDAIQKYCVHQTGLHDFDVHLVLKNKRELPTLRPVFEEMASVWLPHARFSFEAVDAIAPTERGKMQYFVRHV